ncbi:DUF2971 domain-containing protein [Shewanella colwelliana]|uniref:DUF2971 domain-containing protein n=1 Tax=Shewanella colwelliana TaxID=23 RepID=UPI0022B0297B|nr:DUF2971 domain-containing protein [Shewanella colwelliana]MCZ4339905.1 DUF2971 domain-containing protein [Shewanella colwelliana]
MEIPNELFKYREFEKYTILSLLSKGLWIPKPEQLNDPFDAQFKISDADVSIEEFKSAFLSFKKWYLENNSQNISYEGFEMLFEDGKPNTHLKEKVNLFREFWDSESKTMGILSLSEDPKSTTMWSHYGQNHTGICIGYDPVLLAPESPNGVVDWLRQVEYVAEKDIVRNSYLLFAKTGMGHSHRSTMELFFKMLTTKSTDWAYEKEWRFLLPNNGGKVFKLEIEAISSITFGLRTSVETKTAVAHLLRYHQKKTKFYQSIRCENTIGLERIGLDSKSNYWLESYE